MSNGLQQLLGIECPCRNNCHNLCESRRVMPVRPSIGARSLKLLNSQIPAAVLPLRGASRLPYLPGSAAAAASAAAAEGT
jgi:hypothetical protein